MAKSKRWINTFLFSFIGGIGSWFLTVAVSHFFNIRPISYWLNEGFWNSFLLFALVPTVVVFALLTLVFKSFFKASVSQLYQLLPDLNNAQTAENVEKLSQQILDLTDDKAKEIDTLTERENYRREFLGNVSHELKTPLFSIQGYLLTLIEGGIEDENIRDKYLNRINKSVERLTYIVKDLDMITELESGNLKLEQKSFNIAALAQEVLDLLEYKAEKNKIKLILDNPSNEPVRVVGDIERIEQVLTNLVVNAINHSSRKAKVIVSFQSVGNCIKTTVKDNGIGIKPEHLDRVFERFYRVDKSRSRTNGGSGLGLSIVKHILEAHDQKIHVKSEFTKGTEFSFMLHKG